MLGAVVAASVSGCIKRGGAQPSSNESTAAAPAGPITEAEALDVVRKLTDMNNQANRDRDSTLLATYEAESSFVLDNAGYIVNRGVDPNNSSPAKEFTYNDPKVYVNPVAEYPQWFVAEATTSKRVAMVFSRETAGEPWKLVHAVTEAAPLPDLKQDDAGQAVLVGTGVSLGYLRSPAEIASAHAAYQTAGVSAAATAGALFGGLQPTPAIVDDSSVRGNLLFVNTKTATMAPAESYRRSSDTLDYPVRALRTADGGFIAMYTLRTAYTAGTVNGITKLKGTEAALAGKTDFFQTITLVQLDQYLTYVPPATGAVTVTVLGRHGGVVSIT